MSAKNAVTSTPPVRWQRRVLLLADLVDSVRLMQAEERPVVERWRDFLARVTGDILPRHHGRLVKSLGDGFLVDFSSPSRAKACADELHAQVCRGDSGQAPQLWFRLRIGLHVAEVMAHELDIFGSGVNLAARIASLAAGGETVASRELVDMLEPGLREKAVPLGPFELKGVSGQVEVLRLPATGDLTPLPTLPGAQAQVLPVMIVLPFGVYGGDSASVEHRVAAELLCDATTRTLAQSRHWHVISRLTAQAYRSRLPSIDDLREQLGVSYVLNCQCHGQPGGAVPLLVTAELADAQGGVIVWAGTASSRQADLLGAIEEAVRDLTEQVAHAVFEQEVLRCRMTSLPRLRSHSLLFGAISMMHKLSKQDFERSSRMLEFLADRHRHTPEVRAWAAKWHVMNVAHGWSPDARENALAGARHTERALEVDPEHPLALAVDGLIAAFLRGDLASARLRYEQALQSDPSESLAWLFLSALNVYEDRADDAVACANQALKLSPLDPLRYYYLSFAANAMLSAGHLGTAIDMATRSLRDNPSHLPTYRTLAIAQALEGNGDAARSTVAALLGRSPDYSVAEFQQRYAGRNSALAHRYAQALADAGLPPG